MAIFFSVQVLGAVDAVIVGTHDHAAGFVVVGVGEVVFFGALVGDADAVDDRIKAAGVNTDEQRVPGGLLELDLDAQLFGQGLAQFHVQAGQLAVIIVVGERRVGTFDTDDQLASGLDFFQLVFTGGFSRGGGGVGRSCCRRSAAAAAGQGGGQGKCGQRSGRLFQDFFMVVSSLSFLYVLVFRFGGSTHPNR